MVKWIECVYKDGKYDEKYKKWHCNGKKAIECVFKNGKKEGKYEKWYDNGRKYIECVYKNKENKNEEKEKYYEWEEYGEKTGKYEEWYQNGRRRIRCEYKDGKIDGKYTEYHENFHIKSILDPKTVEYFTDPHHAVTNGVYVNENNVKKSQTNIENEGIKKCFLCVIEE